LWELHLGKNDLHGEIPTEINLCTHLKALGLEDNKLDGVIADLTNLSSLSK
jgi:Leucine-rich repeat (LRR) protein